ncbi:hypothetical protein GO994_17100 [Aeromonas salmonicida subsp. salmonicida]|nr:hypothetical protein GO992_08200 [Aeromonas salmonicida subsp. salmonicida]QHE48732.1 hypothetical protein GO994_17100 [Aeromonas salmonicida subsp. salmonicida]
MLDSTNLAPYERWWLTLTSPQIAFQTEWREYRRCFLNRCSLNGTN